VLEVLLLTLLAGASIPAGAALAMIERIRPDWLEEEFRHSVIAFGGGVLLAAVALVLVPDGAESLPALVSVALFLIGGVVFLGIDALIKRSHGAAGQLVAMLADFIPEAIAMGAVFAGDPSRARLLALLIALQNLPEGFNAFREVRSSSSIPPMRLLAMMALLAALGPAAGITGHLLLNDHEAVVGGIMLVAAGGILFLTFEDIAPQAELENRIAPPFGAVLGFAAGLAGHLLIGAS